MKNKTGEVREKGFLWFLLNSKPEQVEKDVIEKSEESEELKKSEERLQKMIDKYKIENFESFGVTKKTPRMKKAQIKKNGKVTQIEVAQNQKEQNELER